MTDRLREHTESKQISTKCLKTKGTYSIAVQCVRKDRQNAYKNYVDKIGVERRNIVLDIG